MDEMPEIVMQRIRETYELSRWEQDMPPAIHELSDQLATLDE